MPVEAKIGVFWCVYILMGKMRVEAILGHFAWHSQKEPE